ncbi:putative ribonuclease H-like domain-containing protein [Tanacetum coccineum]
MADHLRPMEELLRIPIVGIENAIVVLAVLADEFKLKTELLDFISNNSFFCLENDDPHSHIRRFYQITRTLKLNQVPDDVVTLILFMFSLKGAAETWLENEPPCSITTWDDLVSKFLNRFYPHSKTRELRKEITNFQQVFDLFYHGLCQSDQDSLNTAAGGNLMMRNIQKALTTIENKARVQTCRNKPQVSSSGGTSTKIDAITALTKQVEALEYHFASMRETYDHNQEALIQLMQNQIGQMAKAFQKSPLERATNVSTYTPKPSRRFNSICDDDYNDEESTIPFNEIISQLPSSIAITPVLPTMEPEDSFIMGDENISTIPEKEPDEFIKSSVEDLVPIPSESEDTSDSDKVCDLPFCDNFVTFSNPLFDANDDECFNPGGDIDEIDVFIEIDDSFPEYETFCFNIEEKSSGSTTTHSDYSLLDYDGFCFDDDHIEEKSSGSTTTHSDFSLPKYDSFIFDLSVDPFPPADRSVSHHEEFTDELAHIISLSEYDRFYFDLEIIPGEFTRVLKENIFDLSIKVLTVNELNDSSLLLSDCDSTFSEEFSEIDPLVSLPFGNKDKVFDPVIFIIKRV